MAGAPSVGVPYEDYTWASIDQRMPDAPAPYDLHHMVQLEAEYQKVNYGKRMVQVKIEGLVFTVDLGTMRQINAQGKHRKVVRMPAEKPAWAGRGGYSSTKPTVTSPTSVASAAVWYSVNPTDGCRDEYARRDALALEDALQKLKSGGSPRVAITIGSWNFTVNVREMRQYNSKGKYRKVVRNAAAAVGGQPAKKAAAPVAALPRPRPAATSPTTPVPSPLVSNPSYATSPSAGTPASVSSLVGNIDFSSPTWDSGEYDGHGAVFSPCGSTCPSMSPSGSNAPSPTHAGTDPLLRYKKALEVVAGVEPIVEVVKGKPLDTAAAALLRDIPTAFFSEAELLYGEILAEIKRERWVREKFGAANLTKDDEDLFGIPVGAKVPNYYANVVSETIYRRKVLSLLGLRNLVRNGARIFSDMQRTLFAGDTSLYKNGEGLMLMRHLTGNTVDLDEVVLRCDKDTLKHINASNRKEGKTVFTSVAEFAKSSQAQKIALSSARNVLGLFSTKLGLTTDQRKRRKVFLADGDFTIPRATGCNDRGKYAAWMYTIDGTTSFHANAPNLPDVIGSLLLAPWHAIKAYCLLCTRFHGDELRQKKSEFYEDCIDDSCFNGKWKSIERFLQNMADESTLRHLIGKCEQDNQNRLMAAADLSDDDYVDALYAVAKEKRLRGLNTKGVNAEVTRQDVYAYVCEAPPAPLS